MPGAILVSYIHNPKHKMLNSKCQVKEEKEEQFPSFVYFQNVDNNPNLLQALNNFSQHLFCFANFSRTEIFQLNKLNATVHPKMKILSMYSLPRGWKLLHPQK